jgi:phosphohistidine phosphatase
VKRLFILRHAKSSWKDETLDDFDRPLNKRGKNDLNIMYKVIDRFLKQTNTDIEYLLSSSSVRTTLTIEAIFPEKEIDYKFDLYNADENKLRTCVEYLSDEYDTVLVCGHNTAITSFVNSYGNKQIDNVPTCAFCEIVFDCESWHDIDKQNGRLSAFEYPKKYY